MAPTIAVTDRVKKRRFERECERLRPLGEAYVGKRFAGRLNHADAQDVVADVIIHLDRKFDDGQRYENLRAAFFRSVTNKAIDYVRWGNGSRPTLPYDEVLGGAAAIDVSPEEQAEHQQEREVVREALLRIPRHYRQALYLRFGVGLTAPAIAERQTISLPAAKRLLLRATRKVREQFFAIVGGEHCPEMREFARRQLIEKYVTQLGSKQEIAIVQKHLDHCGSCTRFVSRLHDHLHELGTAAVFSTSAHDQFTEKAGMLDHLSGWAGSVGDVTHAGAEKVREVGFRVANAMPGGDAAPGGVLATGGQKIAAICATGAAAATCVGASGVVGPGLPGVDVLKEDKQPPAQERTVVEEPPPPTDTLPEQPPTTTTAQAVAPPPTEEPKPVEQVNKELYGSGSATSSSGSSTQSRDFAAPVGGSSTGGGGGDGSGGSRENFGP